MSLNDPPQKQKQDLEIIRQNFMVRGQVKEAEIMRLILLSSEGAMEVRHSATDLLLAPPCSNEIDYYEKLRECLTKRTTLLGKLPIPILDFLLDTVAMTGKLPPEPSQAHFLKRLLKKPSRQFLQNIFSKPYPLEPFLRLISPLAMTQHTRAFHRKKKLTRWRNLRNCILSTSGNIPSWAENTLKDLAPLMEKGRRGKVGAQGRRKWRVTGRALLALPGEVHPNRCFSPLKKSAWNGLSVKELKAFDELLLFQGLELMAIRSLCHQVSLQTGRVVLSLHNATLGAAGGWAHESLSSQFSHKRLFQCFVREGKAVSLRLLKQHGTWVDLAEMIEAMWERRILHPKVYQSLWESRVRRALDPRFDGEWRKNLERASALIPADQDPFVESSCPCVWPGALAPHQRLSLENLRFHAQRRKTSWKKGLFSLGGFIQSGQKLIRQGRLKTFVIPWIDKFFISSRRSEDREYLVSLLRWLHDWGGQPIILFWEDTGRAREPSFFLALEAMRKTGQPMRGIGVFDDHKSRREEALEIICAEHKHHAFFALRPFTDTHFPLTLQQILREGTSLSMNTYDSSWKDDLCFLYAGTQVADLLSIQTTMENWTPWVCMQGRKIPFGQYMRARLRQGSGLQPAERSCVDAAHARWANLE